MAFVMHKNVLWMAKMFISHLCLCSEASGLCWAQRIIPSAFARERNTEREKRDKFRERRREKLKLETKRNLEFGRLEPQATNHPTSYTDKIISSVSRERCV